MAIRWKRVKKENGLAGVCQSPRGWYLQDSETDQEYMRVVWEEEQVTPARPAGWAFVLVNPSTERNRTSMNRWDDHTKAKAAADIWWERNRETHVAKFKDK